MYPTNIWSTDLKSCYIGLLWSVSLCMIRPLLTKLWTFKVCEKAIISRFRTDGTDAGPTDTSKNETDVGQMFDRYLTDICIFPRRSWYKMTRDLEQMLHLMVRCWTGPFRYWRGPFRHLRRSVGKTVEARDLMKYIMFLTYKSVQCSIRHWQIPKRNRCPHVGYYSTRYRLS